MSELDQLYQAVIVEHDRALRNHGPLPGATHRATVDNPLCGDVVTLALVIGEGGAIRDVAFEGQGCALSRAAASLLTTRLAGGTVAAAHALAAELEAYLASPPEAPAPASLGELAVFGGVRAFRSRRACVTLALRALRAATATAATG